ncbi:DUF7269 family protein [Halomarina litorea]|uniref:DUF7269 family protein n=1 Tax=Halomarina litorea TaxID=2961595 RepID=UPI0020C21199|nr:hypothetical protein [Halomarina sp. BCD28]
MRRLAVLGALLALLGLAVAFVPSLLGNPLPSVLVSLVGAAALLGGVRVGLSRYANGSEPVLPTPERRQSASVPGDGFDVDLGRASRHGRVGGATDRDRLRDDLHATAVEVLVRYDGNSPAEAADRLAAGTWTDDRHAAAFFAAEPVELPLTDRVRFAVTSDSAFRRQATHAVAALDGRVAGGR